MGTRWHQDWWLPARAGPGCKSGSCFTQLPTCPEWVLVQDPQRSSLGYQGRSLFRGPPCWRWQSAEWGRRQDPSGLRERQALLQEATRRKTPGDSSGKSEAGAAVLGPGPFSGVRATAWQLPSWACSAAQPREGSVDLRVLDSTCSAGHQTKASELWGQMAKLVGTAQRTTGEMAHWEWG